MDEPRNEAACNALIAEIKKLLLEVGGDEEGLVMTSYESDDDGEHCYNYELLSLDGLRAGYFTDPDDIPDGEEELLEAIQEIEIEPWETLDEEELTELRDYLTSEIGEAEGAIQLIPPLGESV
jgi:hypothetical protein